jgi:streptogramin lyase
MFSLTALHRSVIAAAALAAFAVPAAAHASGTVTEFPTPTPNSGPLGITSGPDGNVWFTEAGGASPTPVGKIDTTGKITEFAADGATTVDSITTGPDGNLWYTVPGVAVGRITPAGVAKNFAEPNVAHGIATGPDKHLYVVGGNDKIIEVAPSADGTTVTDTPISIPTAGSNPQQIVAGPDGNMWFTESNTDKVGRVNLNASPKTITEFNLSTGAGPRGIAVGPDKKIWVAEANAKKVGSLKTDGTGYKESLSSEPTATDAEGLALGRDGNMWVTYFNGPAIGRVTSALTFNLFPSGPAPSTGPRYIAAGADGNMWFTDQTNSKIGRITVDKPVTKPTGDKTPPVLSKLSVSPRTFVVGTKKTASAAKKHPVGTTIRFTSSEAVTATLAVDQKTTGRVQGKSCKKLSSKNRHAKHCTRYVHKLTLTRAAKAGATSVAFSGRVGKTKLASGSYRLTATAKDKAGNATRKAVSRTFKVVKR